MRKSWQSILILSCAFLSLQCVETLITIRVIPDGRYLMNFTTRGDSVDVFDNDFLHPRGSRWTTFTDKEINSSNQDTIWIQKSEALLTDSSFFQTIPSPAPLTYPLVVKRERSLFSTTYKLNQTFTGRRAFQKYPEFAKSLENLDSDSTRWIAEALFYMVTQAMEDLQAQPEIAINRLLLERIQNHLRGIFYRVHEKSMFADLTAWEKFIRSSLGPFLPQLPERYLPALLKSIRVYKDELTVTTGLRDDNFIYQALLPGQVTSTNADSIFGDTLKWYFTLDDFLNDDYQIQATSILYSARRIQTTILISALVILGILILWFKKRPKP